VTQRAVDAVIAPLCVGRDALALAFQARFAAITDFQRVVYVVTLMLGAAATALLIMDVVLGPQAP
jgi:Family of unknown function (DUF6328)